MIFSVLCVVIFDVARITLGAGRSFLSLNRSRLHGNQLPLLPVALGPLHLVTTRPTHRRSGSADRSKRKSLIMSEVNVLGKGVGITGAKYIFQVLS